MNKKLAKSIGIMIKTARKEKGVTQKQLAELLDRQRTTIIDLEAGRRQITLEQIVILSNLFQKPVCYFLSGYTKCVVLENEIEKFKKKLYTILD